MNEIKVLFPSFPHLLPGVPFEENPLPLRLGETLPGRVIQQIDPKHAFLQLKGQNLLVESQVPLPPGADLQFRVEEIQPKVTLKLFPPETLQEQKICSLLKRVLAGDVPLGSLAQKLSALGERGFHGIPPPVQESWKEFLGLLRGFSPSGLFATGPGALPSLLAQSGFFWESKLKNWVQGEGKDSLVQLIQGDMKGLGKKLLGQLKDSEDSSSLEAMNTQEAEELKQGLEPFLRKIELYQMLNLKHSAWPDPFYLFFPFWFGNHLQFVELNLSFPRKKSASDGREELSVLFLLNLPALGKVRIEVQIKEKDLFCRLMVSNPPISEFFHLALPSLSGRLQQLGFHPHIQLSVEPFEKPYETLASDLARGPQALFNIII